VKLYGPREVIAMGVAGSRPTLDRLIKNFGFPPGRLVSPNRRAWTEEEIAEWVSTRPTAKKAAPPRKAAAPPIDPHSEEDCDCLYAEKS
jgi:predicted DNA-binding transcriptional regulator AlpA